MVVRALVALEYEVLMISCPRMRSSGTSPRNPYMTGQGVPGTIAHCARRSSQLLKEVGISCSARATVEGSKILSVPHLERGRYDRSS